MNLAAITGAFAHIPTDWIILFAIVLLVTFDSLRAGASRAIALSLALPLTFAISQILLKTAFVGPMLKPFSTPLPAAIIMLIVLAVATVLMYRITRDYIHSSLPMQALAAGLATGILLVVFWIQIPALSGIWHFSAQASRVFGATYAFFWIILSYLMLVVVRR